MRISLIKLILLMGLVVSTSSCLLMREDLYDIHKDDTTQQGTGTEPTAGITVDTGDGLITKEHPATPLSDTFTIVLDTKPTATVTLGTIQSSDTGEVTVSPSSLTFTTANWDIPQTVTVTGVDDALTDDMQTVIINLGIASGGDYTGIDPGDVTVNNLDDETPSTPMVILITGDGLVTAEHPTTPLSDTFNIALNSAPTASVTVGTILSSDTGEVSVSPSSLTFTTGNWGTPQSVTVTGVDDLTNDGMQTIPVTLGNASSSDPNWNGLSAGSVTVHNLDDDAPKGITVISGTSMLVTENGGASTFEVVLDSAPSADVTIDVSSSDTFEGVITSPASGTLTFTSGNWDTPQTVTVSGVDDALSDGNQSFTVILDPANSGDAGYNGMNPSDVTYINIDDDVPGTTVLAGSLILVSENGSSSFFDVVLNSQPSADVIINISSDTPSEGTVSTGSITFTNGNWNVKQTITVTGVDDPDIDGNQAFTVVLNPATSTDTGYAGIDPDDVSFLNVDNDAPGITVNAGATMLVSENGSWSSFEVVLNAPPTANVDIDVWSNNVAEGDVSIPASGTLTFNPGNWSTPQIVRVVGVNDDAADGNQSFSVLLDPALSTDGNFNGIDPPNVSFINADDDIPGVTVFAGSSLIVFEGGSSCSFEVVLNSQPSANVNIDVWSDDPSEGTVSVPASGTLTFDSGNWNIPQSVTVSSANDAIVDGNTPFSVVLDPASSGDAGYLGIDPDDVSFTCIDDDSPAVKDIVVIAAQSMLVSENGGSSSFDVVLTAAPTDDVDINAWSDTMTEGDITFPPLGAIQFTTANWNIPKTVTVTGQDDPVVDGNQPFTIILDPATSLDPGYNGIDPNNVSFVNVDDDAPGITVSAGSLMLVSENGSSSAFEVVLNSKPSADVTITLGVSDATEGAVAPSPLTFTDLNWDTPQTVTVTGLDDSVADLNVSFWVLLNPAISGDLLYSGIDPDDVLFSNIDDDAPGITVSIGDGLITKEHPTAPLQDTFSIVLNSEPAGDVTIPITSDDTSEVTVSDAIITFTPADWDSAQIITVTGVDDALPDDMQPVNITLGLASSPLDTNYDFFNPDDVTVYNLDDEALPAVIILGSGSPAGYITTENGAVAEIQVVLSAQPTADVDLGPISSDTPAEGIVNPPSNLLDITLTPSTWDCPQTITVYGVDDAMIDGDIGYTIDLGITSSTDGLWAGIDPGDVPVTNMALKLITDYGWGPPNVEAGSFMSLQGNGTSTLITLREVDFYDGYDPEDEGYEYVPIGFTFYYVGMPYEQVTAYSNGFISFLQYHNTANIFVNDYLFDSSVNADYFQNILAPWWDDLTLIAAGSDMYYETTGTAPNRTFIIEWHKAIYNVPSDDTFTFQIKLHESTNEIEFIYGPVSDLDTNNDSSASIGIKDHIGGSTHFIEGVSGVTTSPPPPDSSKKVTDFPAFETVIRFIP